MTFLLFLYAFIFLFVQVNIVLPTSDQELVSSWRAPSFEEVLGNYKKYEDEYVFFNAYQEYWFNTYGSEVAKKFMAQSFTQFTGLEPELEHFNITLHKFCSDHIFEKSIQGYRDLRACAGFCICIRAYDYIKKYHLTMVKELIDCEAAFLVTQARKCLLDRVLNCNCFFESIDAHGIDHWLEGDFLKKELAKNKS